MAICMKCSAAVIDAAKFCAACGTPVAPPPASRAVDPLAATAAVAPVRPSSYGPPPAPQPGFTCAGAAEPVCPRDAAADHVVARSRKRRASGRCRPLLAASFAGVPIAPPPPSWSAQPQVPSAPYGGAAQAFPPQQGYGAPPPQPGQPPPLYSAQAPYPAAPQQQPQYGAPPQQAPAQQVAPPPQQAPWGVQSPAAFGVGARVLVQWADGNRYPATVSQAAPGQCLVAFPDGRQQWIEVQYLSSGI